MKKLESVKVIHGWRRSFSKNLAVVGDDHSVSVLVQTACSARASRSQAGDAEQWIVMQAQELGPGRKDARAASLELEKPNYG